MQVTEPKDQIGPVIDPNRSAARFTIRHNGIEARYGT
jgi:hypothetical protein